MSRFKDICRHYQDLEIPSVGVPLHGGRLPARAINSIFDKALDVEDGNLLLRRLQHRRLSGALAHEPLDYFPESSVSSPSELAGLGLKYLREKFPMDEQRQADAYAEREVNKAEKQLIQRAQRMGIYKSDDASESSTSDASSDPGPLYGESVLERVRKANEARRREREAREAREAQAAQEAEAQAPVTASATASSSSSTALDTPRKRPAWVAKWAERATLSTAPEAPTLSLTRRIFPSLMLLLAIVGGCVLYTSTYTPPARANRLLPDTPTALATIGALIGANAAVFVAWRLPPLWPLLNRYAVLVPGQPYAASLLGNVFSHQKGAHLLLNMGMLALLGTRLHEGIGRAAFLSVFLCSGAAGGLASLVYYTLTRNFTTSSFGASGAVAGILAAVCLVDGARVMGFGKGGEEKGWLESLLVLPGWTLLGAMVAADVVGMRTRRQPVDHVAHLGGYAAGALGALVINWKMGQKEKEKGKGEDGVAMERVEAEKRDGPNVNKSK
ncbi:MAG: hypothetical protein M1822_004057 [Bathelium mastoideum]|nr:MAG: hypothetical protein M1822_004057 [Bathelium mastoideum]